MVSKVTPPEVWALILANLSRPDLARISRVSSLLASLSRPHLYRAIRLQSDKPTTTDTFSLLRSTPTLAAKVEEATFFTTVHNDWKKQQGWLDLVVISQFTGLKTLILKGYPFKTAKDQEDFGSAIKQSCPKLKAFVYHSSQYPRIPTIGDRLELPQLERLTWDDVAYFTSGPLRSIIVPSLSTLTHLALIAHLDSFEAVETATFLRSSRFPNLQSFSIGSFLDVEDSTASEDLTQFLIAHPTIRSLSLGYTSDDEWYAELDPSTLVPGMLPSLHHLSAHVVVIHALISAQLLCLTTTLHTLSIGQGMRGDADWECQQLTNEVSSMLSVRHATFGALKTLKFDPGESLTENGEVVGALLTGFAAVCPGVERLGLGYFSMGAFEEGGLAGVIERFGKVEVFELPIHMFNDYSMERKEEFARSLGGGGGSLKGVRLVQPESEGNAGEGKRVLGLAKEVYTVGL